MDEEVGGKPPEYEALQRVRRDNKAQSAETGGVVFPGSSSFAK